jgi:hypothetical protein
MPAAKPDHGFRPGESRYLYDEEAPDKHVPLASQSTWIMSAASSSARCVRFQEDIADDPVIGFSQRGRALEIVSLLRSRDSTPLSRQHHRHLPGRRADHGGLSLPARSRVLRLRSAITARWAAT